MKRKRMVITLLAIVAAMGTVGCDDLGKLRDRILRRESSTKRQLTEDPMARELAAFHARTHDTLLEGNFAELERMAKEYREAKAVFGDGCWKINAFYDSFEFSDRSPERWTFHEDLRKRWIAEYPPSVTARVAYAKFFTDYAWHARGSGYANTVSTEGWERFRDRLEKAHGILEEARALPEQCPGWWDVAFVVALGQSWEPEDYEALYTEAKNFSPTYWHFDTRRAYSLLPRWHGEPGDWETFALKAADWPGAAGHESYARIVMAQMRYYTNVFKETRAEWPRTRQGLEALHASYPEAVAITSRAARLAFLADDRAFARRMFEAMGDHYLKNVWGKSARYQYARKWALEE